MRLCFPLLEHARKVSVNKTSKTNGGWIMKAKYRLLTVLVPATGLAFLSLPAGAECWMTCPPGSTATPSATEKPATAEWAASTEELTPAKNPEATAKASPASLPAKVEPTASTEELTPAKKPEATAKAPPAPVPAKPKTATPTGADPATDLPPAHADSGRGDPVSVPQSSETNAAFQPAPSQAAPPAPDAISGPVPGTATMHVIPQ